MASIAYQPLITQRSTYKNQGKKNSKDLYTASSKISPCTRRNKDLAKCLYNISISNKEENDMNGKKVKNCRIWSDNKYHLTLESVLKTFCLC